MVGEASPSIPNPNEIAEVGWFRLDELPMPATGGALLVIPDAVAGLRGACRMASLDS